MFIDYDTVLPFGKHEGLTANTILEIDPTYLVWLAEETDHEIHDSLLGEAYMDSDNESDFGYLNEWIN